MKLKAVKSTFPIALGMSVHVRMQPQRFALLLTLLVVLSHAGAKISGVDDNTFSSTGESFSHIILPHSSFSCDKTLQADDTSLGASLPPPVHRRTQNMHTQTHI